MANVVDTIQQLTITLLGEGYGTAVSFIADKATAYPGDTVNFSFTVRNDGQLTDDLFARVMDMDTGSVVLPDHTFPAVPVSGTVNYSFSVTMPSRNLTLKLEAGHAV